MRTALAGLMALAMTVSVAFGAPGTDATHIAARYMLPQTVEGLREALREPLTRAYARALNNLGVRIVSPERFAAMIPDGLTDPLLQRFEAALADTYTEHLGPNQLALVAAFLDTDVGVSVMKASIAQTVQRPDSDTIAFLLPYWSGLDEDILRRELSQDAQQSYQDFMALEGVQAVLEEEAKLHLAGLSAFMQAHHFALEQDPDIRHPFLRDVFEARGVVEFQNFIQRKTLIAQFDAIGR